MNAGGDAAEQVVRMSLEGVEVAARISGEGAKQLAILIAAVLKEEQKTHGKARLSNMIKSACRHHEIRKLPLSGRLRSCGHWKRKSPVSWKCYQTLRNRYGRSLRQSLIPTSAWYSSTGTSTTIRGSR